MLENMSKIYSTIVLTIAPLPLASCTRCSHCLLTADTLSDANL